MGHLVPQGSLTGRRDTEHWSGQDGTINLCIDAIGGWSAAGAQREMRGTPGHVNADQHESSDHQHPAAQLHPTSEIIQPQRREHCDCCDGDECRPTRPPHPGEARQVVMQQPIGQRPGKRCTLCGLQVRPQCQDVARRCDRQPAKPPDMLPEQGESSHDQQPEPDASIWSADLLGGHRPLPVQPVVDGARQGSLSPVEPLQAIADRLSRPLKLTGTHDQHHHERHREQQRDPRCDPELDQPLPPKAPKLCSPHHTSRDRQEDGAVPVDGSGSNAPQPLNPWLMPLK